MDRATFVKQWSEALEKGSAAVFIGAGLSRPAGYPDWRGLLRDVAATLGLDIDDEHDLAAVAQYSINKSAGKRSDLSRLIAREFKPTDSAPESYRLLARLPLQHLWTTNYDQLAETAWRQERKLLDVKSRNEDLGIDKPWAHAILYKMHGSVDHPADVVIAKDDYELYRQLRPGFVQVLTGQLVSRQMLFLGFSFTDPNLGHLFGNIRESFRENGPEHYAIVRKPAQSTGRNAKARFKTEQIRHDLWMDDLRRYGIRCIEIDDYAEIDEIIREVESRLARRNVLVSGSYPDIGGTVDLEERSRIEAVARCVGALIADRGKRLVSGFGLVVGSAAISGVLSKVLGEDTPNIDKSLLLYPFPQEAPAGLDFAAFRARYRDALLRQAGVAIFISGLKDTATARQIADGVMEEYAAAIAAGRPVIPLGATGGAAAEIWRLEEARFAETWPSKHRADFDLLNDPKASVVQLVDCVERLLRCLDAS